MAQQQATRTDVQAVTLTQSLTSVQTLLKAGLGCITYMRDLLPQDNFTESHFTSTDESSMGSQSSSASSPHGSAMKRNVAGFKIMTMSRGYTDEADRIINYLEYGIFDALEKQYLRKFMFAIYLDSKDPNNIIEAYTFNFQYYSIPGTTTTVPLVSVGDNLAKTPNDPVAKALRTGRVPTLKEVKRSVKALLKTLISSMTQMDVLPKRRFASFKVFYTDATPADYEPPHFHAGDSDKDRWFFMTHEIDELPDKWNVGKLDTGHHTVDVNITSIATYLPSSTENENAPFAGTTNTYPNLTPAEESAFRADQAQKQEEDAEARNIAWNADDEDGEADDDPDYVRQPDGTYVEISKLAERQQAPVGVRNGDGVIQELFPSMDVDEALYGGVTQPIPQGLGALNDMLAQKAAHSEGIEQTQDVDDPVNMHTPPTRTPTGGSNRNMVKSPEIDSITSPFEDDIDTQLLQKLVIHNMETVDADSEMLDMETQTWSQLAPDPIQSFENEQEPIEIDDSPVKAPPGPRKNEVMECDCGITKEDGACLCEGNCGRWYHAWCMGYHSAKDPRLPKRFICFDCRIKNDLSWDLIKVDIYPAMISKFKELALFRRAIKIAEKYDPSAPSEFATKMDCDATLARTLFKRLEQEGFITEVMTVVDDIGFSETKARNKTKAKPTKAARPRRNAQRTKYRFNKQSKKSQAYLDYFDPSHEVESRLLGLAQLKPVITPRPRTPAVPPAPADRSPTPIPLPSPSADSHANMITPRSDFSQTMEETQIRPPTRQAKRAAATRAPEDSGNGNPRPAKKMKISVAPGVDLAE